MRHKRNIKRLDVGSLEHESIDAESNWEAVTAIQAGGGEGLGRVGAGKGRGEAALWGVTKGRMNPAEYDRSARNSGWTLISTG